MQALGALPELLLGENLNVEDEVSAIICEHFPDGMESPTDAALARGRAKIIFRDAANDDLPEAVAASA